MWRTERGNLLLHALVLLVLQGGELNHLPNVLLQVLHLQLQSVAMQLLFQDLRINRRAHIVRPAGVALSPLSVWVKLRHNVGEASAWSQSSVGLGTMFPVSALAKE